VEPILRAEVLQRIADSPANLELRALALSPDVEAFRSGQGLLLVDPGGELVGAVGQVVAEEVAGVYRVQPTGCDLLADATAHTALRQIILFERARILTLASAWSPSRAAECDVRHLDKDVDLGHLPTDLRGEIDGARQCKTVFSAFVDAMPVCFSYAGWMTETLADISVDTLAAYRRRGLAAATAIALVDEIIASGKTPVWGATENNTASLGLADKLGFREPAGTVYVAAGWR
jgi:GNAT superfamily N-acetyltransferase